MPSLAELKALMAEQERQAAELRELFLKTQQEEEERLKKEEEERIRRETEERQRKEAEEKRLAEEARVAEIARKAEEERKRVEEEDRVRKASETTGSNRVDVNMTTESEWSRMSPLSTSWALIAFSAVEQMGQPKASGSRVRARSKTPARKHSVLSVGKLPIPCYTCEKKGEPEKCARTG